MYLYVAHTHFNKAIHWYNFLTIDGQYVFLLKYVFEPKTVVSTGVEEREAL